MIHAVLIVAPVNTLENWRNEFARWVPKELHVYTNLSLLLSSDAKAKRMDKVSRWYNSGGVLVMGNEMYRNLVAEGSAQRAGQGTTRGEAWKCLVDPGPDLIGGLLLFFY